MYIFIHLLIIKRVLEPKIQRVLERSEDLEEFRKGPMTSEELQTGPKTSWRRWPQSRGALAAAMKDVNEPVKES